MGLGKPGSLPPPGNLPLSGLPFDPDQKNFEAPVGEQRLKLLLTDIVPYGAAFIFVLTPCGRLRTRLIPDKSFLPYANLKREPAV